MANIDTTPRQDVYSFQLTQELTSGGTTMYINVAPDFTVEANEKWTITLNSGKSNMEAIECDDYDSVAGTMSISARGLNLGDGYTNGAQSHGIGSVGLMTNNYAFYESLQTAVNSKASTDGDNTWTGTNIFTDDVSFTGATTDITMPNKTTAERTASGSNGDIVYDTDDGLFYQYKGGVWASIDTGTATPTATETVAGVSELATLAEQGAHTETGGAGTLVLQSKNTLKIPATYTPAFLTGGTGATAVIGTWQAVTDGSVRITIDGTQRDVSGLDFSADADMDAVAATIQTGIRALTSSTETVAWSTDHFIVSSVLTTSSSAITVTIATGVGTDISGVGGTAFMDADAGAVTAKVLDQTQDENKVPVLDSTGKLKSSLVGGVDGLTAALTEINQVCDGVGVTVTTTNLDSLTDGSAISTLHNHSGGRAFGTGNRGASVASGDQVIAHGLGATPSIIRITAYYASCSANRSLDSSSTGISDLTTTSYIYKSSNFNIASLTSETSNSTGYIILIRDGATSNYQKATVAADDTNITLTWQYIGYLGGNIVYSWEAEL